MGMIEDAIRLELFNNARFMMDLGQCVAGYPYREARAYAIEFIQDRIIGEYDAIDWKEGAIKTFCWWAVNDVDLRTLAEEALDILGVR